MARTIALFRRTLRREAAIEWGLSPWLAEAIFVLPLVAALVVALTLANRPFFAWLTAEDSLLEWAQFTGYLASGLIGLTIAGWLWRAGRRLSAVCYVGFSLGCLFVAGEEIAWGQRLLGFQTPAELDAINHQEEFTVHNITNLEGKLNIIWLLLGFYGSVGSWLARLPNPGRRSEFVTLGVPPLFLSSSFLILFAYKFARFVLVPTPVFTVVRYGELAELCFALGLATFAFLSRRWLCAGAPASEAAEDGRLGRLGEQPARP